MGQYSYSQPSSSSPATQQSEQVDLNKGIMTRCHCGGLLGVEVARSGDNRGRLQYKCCFDQDGRVHDDRWWDVAVTEELLRIRKGINQMEERLGFYYLNRMNKIEDSQRELGDKLNKTIEDLYYSKRPMSGKLRVFGGAIKRKTRVVWKYWVVITLAICLIMSVVFNLAAMKRA